MGLPHLRQNRCLWNSSAPHPVQSSATVSLTEERASWGLIHYGPAATIKSAIYLFEEALDLGRARFERLGRAGRRYQLIHLGLELINALNERQIELMDRIELLLFDPHGIKETRITVARKSNTILQAIEFLQYPVNWANFDQPPARSELAHECREPLLERAQAIGQVLAVQFINIAPALAIAISAVARDPVRQPFKPARLAAHLAPPFSRD
jgi:hypothetical protein